LANLTELYNSVKSSPDNQLFINFTNLLEFKLDVIKKQLIQAVDSTEMIRLQGRAQELQDILDALRRQPVSKPQYTGSFN